MAIQTRHVGRAWGALSALLLVAALSVAGCAGSGTGSASGTTTAGAPGATHTSSGPAATATAISAPPHAFAWYQYDSHNAPQIWASVNGASPTQITHVAPPDPSGCDNEIAWSPPVFSPNLTHIVAALGGYGCGDGALTGDVSTIDVASGVITNVPAPALSIRLTERAAGWLDNSDIWFAAGDGHIYTYHLGASASTALPSISNSIEAAVRGATLFWASVDTSSAASWAYTLHRYDLGTSTPLPGVVSLGSWGTCQCSPGDMSTPGWDASPDGLHVAYQVVSPHIAPTGGIASSHIYYASADGSGASEIARAMITTQMIKMQISPDGQWVAFTGALPTPATLTASVSSGGGSGDPTFHGYSPDAFDYPVWKWDSTQFWASKISTSTGPTPGAALYRFTRGGGSAIGVDGGFNAWYTIGS